ncbi:acyl-CoA dehydrogenase family protein [Actinomadura fulvescens]|uniref:Acyl-CoA dehydrogenase family protein n=1 Tax=Actinomadura fulvescens TaxID=46160 RepID=A0ABP6BNT9_9ACTN
MGLLEETAHAVLATGGPWPALEEAGLTGIGVPEDAGGSGGTLAEAAAVLRIAAYHAAPVPLAETAWLAGPLLASAGLPLPAGPLTAVVGEPRRVPYARSARRLVVLDAGRVSVFDLARAGITPGANLAGEPRDDVSLASVRPEATAPTSLTAADVRLRGALARAVQLTGAARRALDLTVRYAGEREQFGRPIGRFQAVQQQLAELAGEVAVADVAVRAAVGTPDDPVAVAAAKANASRAAGTVAAIAHQIHGAIGVTEEHELRRATLRLWSWREEYGDEHHWAGVLGELDTGPWSLVTGS